MRRVALYIIRRSIRVATDFVGLIRRGEIRKAGGLAGRILFDVHQTFLFAAPLVGSRDAGVASADLTVRAFSPESVERNLDRIGRLCESRAAMSFAGQGATAYVAFLADVPVGIGWKFAISRPLLRLYSDGVMLGAFFVEEDFRGRGIYGHLVRVMSRDVQDSGRRAFAETARGNRISQRGLISAGFRCEGEFSFVTVLGVVGPVRLRRGAAGEGLGTHPVE